MSTVSESGRSARMNPKHPYPQPPFKKQSQESPGLETQMEPKPDYGRESYKGLGRLRGKVALVTGGDSGIGRAVALAYAREGANVCVSYLNEHSDANETLEAVQESGQKCHLVSGDLSEETNCQQLIEQCIRQYDTIDILVLNHAYQGKSVSSIEELSHERVLHTFKTNIVSFFDIVRFALPHMKPGACIITTGSIQAYQPSDSILDYACTKASIVDFTKGLAQKLIDKGIRVNCVAPGPIWTPLVVSSFPPEKNAEFGKHNSPMSRPGQPVELAPAYVFLATNESSYVNGEIMAVTGGTPTM